MPRSGRPAFDKIIGYIKKAKDAGGEVLIGGTGLWMFAFFERQLSDKQLQETIPRDTSFNLL